ncbi:DUF523 domain-containing protein [Oceanobacter mangrovi]|uniref:DUF523 domain-containing protein n=1 Tax=Oceanobacter mangrovi TaxID=2862510 RepID=UPI001C8D1B75|nr:DUF523 domain-containing protein [Oceanobacter mangrovi]
MKKLLVSACLLGQPVRYDGDSNENKVGHLQPLLSLWQQLGLLVVVCPEVLGGLPTPRPAAEIIGGQGDQVLAGNSRIITRAGDDVTAEFVAGAKRALDKSSLETAQGNEVVAALLAARSPSCGADGTYDGHFSSTLTTGQGVTAALLEQHGIPCFSPAADRQLLALLQQHGFPVTKPGC